MNTLWIALSVLTPFSLIMLVGNRSLKKALTQEGLCPICQGGGGFCQYCDGLGVIVKSTHADTSQSDSD